MSLSRTWSSLLVNTSQLRAVEDSRVHRCMLRYKCIRKFPMRCPHPRLESLAQVRWRKQRMGSIQHPPQGPASGCLKRLGKEVTSPCSLRQFYQGCNARGGFRVGADGRSNRSRVSGDFTVQAPQPNNAPLPSWAHASASPSKAEPRYDSSRRPHSCPERERVQQAVEASARDDTP